jgi:biopolymer transport protein ExbB
MDTQKQNNEGYFSSVVAAAKKSRIILATSMVLFLCFLMTVFLRISEGNVSEVSTADKTLSAVRISVARVFPDAAPDMKPSQSSLLNLSGVRAFSEKSILISIFKKGGPIMWPLLLASILALGTVINRIFFLIVESVRRDKKAIRKFFEAVNHGDIAGAIRISNRSKYYIIRTLGFALTHKEKSLANALLYAQEREMKRFRRGIPILDTVITLAPLLGLLGTVTGMMGSFALIGGELSTPGAVTGGIAEALIATTYGLGIAITALIPFNFLNTKMESARIEIESAANQLELSLKAHPDDGFPQRAKR